MLEREWNEARRAGQPLSLIMLDIDYFKQYNDHYGHLQGDECLRRVAQALLSASTRGRDFLGRFGGEEFVMVLPDTDAPSAMRVAQRCRDVILEQGIVHEGSRVGGTLTVSVGVATQRPTEEGTAFDLIARVDKRLYAAKQLGRNRIVSEAVPEVERA